MLKIRGTPESRAADKTYRFDTMGVLTFMVTMVALQVLATQGSDIGWTSPIPLHETGGRRLHTLRLGIGVLRHALDRCSALEPAR
jgi:hypothetical protein